jgi:hypothetical protein
MHHLLLEDPLQFNFLCLLSPNCSFLQYPALINLSQNWTHKMPYTDPNAGERSIHYRPETRHQLSRKVNLSVSAFMQGNYMLDFAPEGMYNHCRPHWIFAVRSKKHPSHSRISSRPQSILGVRTCKCSVHYFDIV